MASQGRWQGEDKPSPLLWFDSSQAEIIHSRGDGLSSPCGLVLALWPAKIVRAALTGHDCSAFSGCDVQASMTSVRQTRTAPSSALLASNPLAPNTTP